jgi:hypothetical protein
LKISSTDGLINNRNTIPMFKRVQSEQLLLMVDYRDATSSAPAIVCNHCENNPAEVFQESGDYCLHSWQKITCPNV